MKQTYQFSFYLTIDEKDRDKLISSFDDFGIEFAKVFGKFIKSNVTISDLCLTEGKFKLCKE